AASAPDRHSRSLRRTRGRWRRRWSAGAASEARRKSCHAEAGPAIVDVERVQEVRVDRLDFERDLRGERLAPPEPQPHTRAQAGRPQRTELAITAAIAGHGDVAVADRADVGALPERSARLGVKARA